MKTQLASRLGLFLSIDREKGSIRGTPDADDENTIFFLIPVGLRIVSIQHMDTMLYVAMNSEGKLYASVRDLIQTQIIFECTKRMFSGNLHIRMQIQRIRF